MRNSFATLPLVGASIFTLLVAVDARGDDGLPLPVAPRAKTAAFPTTVTTRFDPELDGLPFPNLGDYASEGNCIGMSLLAVDSYRQRIAAAEAGAPPAMAPKLASDPATADLVGEETASLTQATQMKNLESGADDVNRELPLSNPKNIRAALERIAKTGMPEIMTLDARQDGHATVLYGYKNGKLQIYDPNFPGKTIEWPFDPVKGLGRHPMAKEDADFYGKLRLAGSTPFDQFQTGRDIAAIRSSCDALDKACAGRFETVTGKVEPTSKGALAFTGKISGGLKKTDEGKKPAKPRNIWIAVNGKTVTMARVAKDGTFRVQLPAVVLGQPSNDVRFVATTEEDQLSGYSEIKVPQVPAGEPEGKGIIKALPGR